MQEFGSMYLDSISIYGASWHENGVWHKILFIHFFISFFWKTFGPIPTELVTVNYAKSVQQLITNAI